MADSQIEEMNNWAKDQGVNLPHVNGEAAIPQLRKLSELERPAENDPDELLKDRFLCRGGALLFTGPTGVGKSSLTMQMAICWALGRESFGIRPSGCIKILVVQAENDDGDLVEMRDGIIAGLQLSQDDGRQATDNISIIREDVLTGADFCSMLDTVLTDRSFDVVIIDPTFAFLGGEASSQQAVSRFLRNGLNPVLRNRGCGAILVHHVNKPPAGKEKPNWQAGDHAYAGSGSAEFANWARGVVNLRSIGCYDEFELHLGKRGKRVGWRKEDRSTVEYTKRIAHATQEGQICWREVSFEEQVLSGRVNPDRSAVTVKEHIMPLVPQEGRISKAALVGKAQGIGIGLNRSKGFIAALVAEGQLFVWSVARPGTRPEIQIGRQPQPKQEPE